MELTGKYHGPYDVMVLNDMVSEQCIDSKYSPIPVLKKLDKLCSNSNLQNLVEFVRSYVTVSLPVCCGLLLF